MIQYSCPFCGQNITEEKVLFVDGSFDQSYEDIRRYEFLMSCSSAYPLEDMKNFRGLYYRTDPEKVEFRDSNGFPTVLCVSTEDAFTPKELMIQNEGSEFVPDQTTREIKPKSSNETKSLATRACPHCHCRMPNNFGISSTINVTLLGGRAAGKTVFLISLLQQLQDQLSHNGLGSVQLLPESSAFMQPQIDYYVKQQGISMPTTQERLFPLVFEYFNGSKSFFFAIHDIAGEGIIDDQSQANADYLVNHQGVKKANVVWLVLDPHQLTQGAYSDLTENAQVNDHDKFVMPIDAFLAKAVSATSHLGILRNVEHVIAIMTKMDLPLMQETSLKMGRALIMQDTGETHKNRVDLSALRSVDDEVSRFIQSKLRNQCNAKEMIQSYFKNNGVSPPHVHMMAVSAYTRLQNVAGIEFKNLFYAEASKHRIIEPFLELLVLAKAVPTTQEAAASVLQSNNKTNGSKEPVKVSRKPEKGLSRFFSRRRS